MINIKNICEKLDEIDKSGMQYTQLEVIQVLVGEINKEFEKLIVSQCCACPECEGIRKEALNKFRNNKG